jgi:hypothetical protein
VGGRDGVVEQAGGQDLTVVVEGDPLVHRFADRLGDAACDLAVDDHGVDGGTAVIHHDQPIERDPAGVGVDADNGDAGAGGDGVAGWLEIVGRAQAALALG